MDGRETLAGGPLRIVIGEVLLVLCSLSYLVWWTLTFRPSTRTSSFGGLFLAGAVLSGLAGLVLLGIGVAALLPQASSRAVGATILGGVMVGALLVFLTSTVGRRPVTTELPLIVIWATAQLAAGVTTWTAGSVGPATTVAWIALTTVATLVGLLCYLIFYRLAPTSAYRVGMVPLAVDGLVAAVVAALVALTPASGR